MALVVSVVYDGPAAEVLMFFVGFMPQSALVWLREKLSQTHGVWKTLPLARAGAAHRARGHRPLRPHPAGRGGHQQHRGARPRRHRRPDEQHPHLGRRARRLDRPGDPLPPRRRRHVRQDVPAIRATAAAAVPESTATGRPRATSAISGYFGIRTATDLVQVYEQALRRGGTDPARRQSRGRAAARRAGPAERAAPRRSCAPSRPSSTRCPTRSGSCRSATGATSEFGAVDAWYRYLDGRDWTPRRMRAPKRVKQAMRPLESVPMIGVIEDVT